MSLPPPLSGSDRDGTRSTKQGRLPREERIQVATAFRDARGARILEGPGGFDRMLSASEQIPGGRGAQRLLERGTWPVTIRIRPGRRGGRLARILGDRFVRPGRVERELALSESLSRLGVEIPQPVFSVARRAGLFWHTWLATTDHPEASDGLAFMESARDEAHRVQAARAAGKTLRRLHDAGVRHGDLHLRNLLFEPTDEPSLKSGLRCLVIDLDRARSGPPPLSPRDRMRDWMRLVRSFEKRGLPLSPRVSAAAFGRYCDGDRQLRRAMNQRISAEKRRILWHRIGWRLSRKAGAPPARSSARPHLLLCLWMIVLGCGSPADPLPPDAREGVRSSLIVVGDTGRLRPLPTLFEGQLAVARGMEREAARAPVDGLVLLGDNFYTDGLTRDALVARVRANLVRPYCSFLRLDGPRSSEVSSACRSPRQARHPVPIFAVLGNHDLEHPESARLQREAIPRFVPEWRMSRRLAQHYTVSPGVDLILFESEPAIDDPQAIREALRSAIQAAPGPWRILAAHRPIATDDLGRPRLGGYPQFVRDAIVAAQRPVQLVLAAHHHSLQVFEESAPVPSLQLGLGSGARAEPPLASDDHPAVRFSRRALGFARIDLQRHAGGERLVASLFETARWPILNPFVQERLVARFAVDVRGQVERLAPLTEGHRNSGSDETAALAQTRFDEVDQ